MAYRRGRRSYGRSRGRSYGRSRRSFGGSRRRTRGRGRRIARLPTFAGRVGYRL